MIEYIELKKRFVYAGDVIEELLKGGMELEAAILFAKNLQTADVVEADELKSFAEDVVYQFGYHINYKGRLHLSTGGLSTLEWAFGILEWEDPKPYPEGECEWDGCYEYASCGVPTPDGYKRVCSKHYMAIKAQKEGADNAVD